MVVEVVVAVQIVAVVVVVVVAVVATKYLVLVLCIKKGASSSYCLREGVLLRLDSFVF